VEGQRAGVGGMGSEAEGWKVGELVGVRPRRGGRRRAGGG
jgi:hypothetical protein